MWNLLAQNVSASNISITTSSDGKVDFVENSGEAKSPPFGEAVGFLLSQLGFETARHFGTLMSEVELEPRQYALMRAIDAAEGRSQNEVGDVLRIPPSSMVGVVDLLEERGLVERRPHPTDRRARLLYITAHGKKVLAKGTELAVSLEQAVCHGLSERERRSLLRLLGHVAGNLGLQRGLHPDASTGHGRPHWNEEADHPKRA
jgi:DNA-binding MarR family transcriptional regulator